MMEGVPDGVLLQILGYLGVGDVVRVGGVSSRFLHLSHDTLLWRNLFHSHFRIHYPKYIHPLWCESWREEFVRLVDRVPVVETQALTFHTDEVLHVSFSHDGTRFATTAKDALLAVWKSGHPVELEGVVCMKKYNWRYTQYSQFNQSDSLLLVSGVLHGHHSTSGEIAIFRLKDGLELMCRRMSKPYDIFGTWYSESLFLSGDVEWMDDNVTSQSMISINKTPKECSREGDSGAESKELYHFVNLKTSSIRNLMIANCRDNKEGPSGTTTTNGVSPEGTPSTRRDPPQGRATPPPGQKEWVFKGRDSGEGRELMLINSKGLQGTLQGAFNNWRPLENIADINYSKEYMRSKRPKIGQPVCTKRDDRRVRVSSITSADIHSSSKVTASSEQDDEETPQHHPSESEIDGEEEHVLDPREKWLIFTCGSATYTPHEIGFKRIKVMTYGESMDPGPTLKERIETYQMLRRLNIAGEMPHPIPEFDKIDHVINVHGHIIGMTLSPDHNHLYVNCRPWPEGYTISDPLNPPPIASEIDIHVIDLTTLKEVGMMRRAHRAYTPNEECFFIFLDACDQFVGSGAEDKHAYLWDRHYGISLVKLPHTDVVNAVAFNPKDPEMLVSVSDDKSIKVWRSKNWWKGSGVTTSGISQGTKIYSNRRPRTSVS